MPNAQHKRQRVAPSAAFYGSANFSPSYRSVTKPLWKSRFTISSSDRSALIADSGTPSLMILYLLPWMSRWCSVVSEVGLWRNRWSGVSHRVSSGNPGGLGFPPNRMSSVRSVSCSVTLPFFMIATMFIFFCLILRCIRLLANWPLPVSFNRRTVNPSQLLRRAPQDQHQKWL